MEFITILRFLLPLLGLGIFALTARLVKPTKNIVPLALRLCWITGVLNLLWDVIGTRCRVWHFTLNHLLFGLPLDLYVTVSLVYGGALLLVYWWLRTKHSTWVLTFVVILPIYGVLRDYFGQKVTGTAFLVWDNPYWWIVDFFAWASGLWIVIFAFNRLIAD
jgi:hypothetical protein